LATRETDTPPLAGRRALVTGGGRGIGAAVAESLARAGAAVVVASRTASEIEAVAARLRSGGFQALAIPCDVTEERSVRDLASAALERAGPIDILVNNAGDASAAPLAGITLDEWHRVFAVNATSTFLCLREFVPGMVQRGFGRIVNVASVAGLHGARFVAHYTAAKHAVIGLTRAAAAEFAGKGVTVNAVCPGYADTPMTARNVERVRERGGKSEAEALAALLASAGQRRLVTPSEIAGAVVALCLGDANGQAVVLTGGSEEDLPFEIVNPAALGEPKGWNNGLIAPAGARMLFVAGQTGWPAGAGPVPDGFAAQFARALDQMLEVVREAGGQPHDVARLTVYVSDIPAYLADRKTLGRLWRERFGTYYPAMALVQVQGLVDRGAMVEIEATAMLGGTR
jgi:NAD(P)-dependent dehydrogenase (short-subunit alcohol dehydrogenase family)